MLLHIPLQRPISEPNKSIVTPQQSSENNENERNQIEINTQKGKAEKKLRLKEKKRYLGEVNVEKQGLFGVGDLNTVLLVGFSGSYGHGVDALGDLFHG